MIDLASIFPQFYLTKEAIVRQQYSHSLLQQKEKAKQDPVPILLKSFIIWSLITTVHFYPPNIFPQFNPEIKRLNFCQNLGQKLTFFCMLLLNTKSQGSFKQCYSLSLFVISDIFLIPKNKRIYNNKKLLIAILLENIWRSNMIFFLLFCRNNASLLFANKILRNRSYKIPVLFINQKLPHFLKVYVLS